MPDPGQSYDFKAFPEACFAGLTAIAILAFELATNFQTEEVLADPETYGLMAAGAAVRAFGAAALNFILRRSIG